MKTIGDQDYLTLARVQREVGYVGGTDEGRQFVSAGRHTKFLQVLAEYATTKLAALCVCPAFNSSVAKLRLSYSISSIRNRRIEVYPCDANVIGRDSPDPAFPEDEYEIRSFRHRYGWLRAFSDLFYDVLSRELGSYITCNSAYLVVAYHLLFDHRIDSGQPGTFTPWPSEDLRLIASEMAELAQSDEFHLSVAKCRDALSVDSRMSVENICKNYHRFYPYLFRYDEYYARSLPFFRDVFRLFGDFEFLEIDSDLDYAMLFAHIVYGKGTIAVEDLEDLRGGGGPQFFTDGGSDVHMASGSSRLYMEVPVYATKEYLAKTVPLVLAKGREHYRVRRSNQIPKEYYRGKFISDEFASARLEGLNHNEQFKRVLERFIQVFRTRPGSLARTKHRPKKQQGLEIDEHDQLMSWKREYLAYKRKVFDKGLRLR